MAPHAVGQAAPVSVQRMEESGWPALEIVAWNGCDAPNSTFALPGATAREMSLVIVSCAVADFVGSATLVAVIWTTTADGKSEGAM